MITRVSAHIINKVVLLIPVYYFYHLLFYKTGLCLNEHFNPNLQDNSLRFITVTFELLFLPYAGLVSTGLIALGRYSTWFHFIVPIIIINGHIIIDTILSFFFQGDIGKRIVGLKIHSSNGKKPTFVQFLLRSTIKYISIAFLPVVLIYPFLNKAHITLHDKIAKTNVQETNP